MSNSNRRDFLSQTTTSVAATAALATTATAADPKSEPLVMGLIGCGGRGTHVARVFRSNPNVEFAYVCDPQQSRLEAAAKDLGAREAVADMRRVYDDKRVNAVIVATPDHWHAPASILACKAGKHVYVEKPCSHNLREGRLLVEAARANRRLVQHGTQCRSTPMMIEAIKLLREGLIGDVLVAKAWNIQRRGTIGRGKPSDPPAGFDYDLWVGPAPMIPYQENRVRSGWHWWYHFGTGDMGNDGVHDIDYARWGLGVETHPTFVSAAGGKYVFDDDQQFPDTQQVAFEYEPPTNASRQEASRRVNPGGVPRRRMLIYEQRLWSTNYPMNVDSGAEFYGTKGQMFLSRRGKLLVLNEGNKRVDVKIALGGQDENAHVANFIAAIRTGVPLTAEIEIGHLSASLCHLGNVATRLGRSFRFDPEGERTVDDDQIDRLLAREYRPHWATPG
jgi:predicted dehydrogenase